MYETDYEYEDFIKLSDGNDWYVSAKVYAGIDNPESDTSFHIEYFDVEDLLATLGDDGKELTAANISEDDLNIIKKKIESEFVDKFEYYDDYAWCWDSDDD